jgi:hypothetical protein
MVSDSHCLIVESGYDYLMTKVQLIRKSGNAKTGPIPVSMTERATCPDTCSFKGKDENGALRGCYAEGWPLSSHWDKVATRGVDWATFCQQVAQLPEGQLWRHNQAGDLPGTNNELDGASLFALVAANKGRKGFTYTHKPGARETIALANRNGFTINVSCDSLEQVDRELGNHNPVVVVLPMLEKGEVESKVTYTPGGNRVVTCPAQWRDTSCAECGLCAVSDRDYAVGFRAHGIAKRVTSNLVSASSLVRKREQVASHARRGREMVKGILG